MTATRLAMLGMVGAALSGCQRPETPVVLTTESFVVTDDDQFDMLWEACQTTLRHNRFRLDRVDRRAGVITTHPVTAQQAFEFWRHDVDTPYDYLAASIHTIRRHVSIQVSRGDEPVGTCRVSVTVDTERLSAPERQFNNSASLFRLFGDKLPGEAGEMILTREDDYWIPQGRDGAMERRLLQQITRHAVFAEALPEAVE